MDHVDTESIYEDEFQRADRQPAIEMNIFAAAEEGCLQSKNWLLAGGST
jgi:hypothetical protein